MTLARIGIESSRLLSCKRFHVFLDQPHNRGDRMAARTEVKSPPQNFEITREGAIAILTFVREDRLNALDHRTMQDLIDAFDELGRDDSVLVIVMTGRGKAFVAGADINGYLDIELLDYVNFQRLGRKMYA